MPSYRAFNCREQYVACHWFDQKIFRTGFDCLHGGLDIFVGRNKTQLGASNRLRADDLVAPGRSVRVSGHREEGSLIGCCRWVADPRIVPQTNMSAPRIRLAVIAAG